MTVTCLNLLYKQPQGRRQRLSSCISSSQLPHQPHHKFQASKLWAKTRGRPDYFEQGSGPSVSEHALTFSVIRYHILYGKQSSSCLILPIHVLRGLVLQYSILYLYYILSYYTILHCSRNSTGRSTFECAQQGTTPLKS